ncbi:MAG: hypothetical protein HQ504_01020 [Rhodospirillaceae bacterium]|nr:hypothetical protein [Rhodospirillaceae bacterium]
MDDMSAEGAWPITDIRAFLEGGWSLSRTINDLRQNMPGAMQGHAVIGPAGDRFEYREEGELRFGDYLETVHRVYGYAFPEPHRAEVHYEDGRLFHHLDLSTGFWTVEHLCNEDTYRGAFRIDGPDVWRSNWFVTGPDKEIILDSRYQRQSP